MPQATCHRPTHVRGPRYRIDRYRPCCCTSRHRSRSSTGAPEGERFPSRLPAKLSLLRIVSLSFAAVVHLQEFHCCSLPLAPMHPVAAPTIAYANSTQHHQLRSSFDELPTRIHATVRVFGRYRVGSLARRGNRGCRGLSRSSATRGTARDCVGDQAIPRPRQPGYWDATRPQLSRRGWRTAASPRRCTSRAAQRQRRPPRYCSVRIGRPVGPGSDVGARPSK
jgi:hypothetical protein